MKTELHFSSKTDDWATPQDFFDNLNKTFNFTLDPCSSHENHKCAKYYTKDDDGLTECCATCRHNKTEWSEEHVGKRTHAKCSKKCFDIVVFHDDLWDTFKMLCPEWAPREEKE